jgi:hypothetical protein
MNVSRITGALLLLTTTACANNAVTAVPQSSATLRSSEESLSRSPVPLHYRVKGPIVTTLREKAKSPVLFVTDAGTGEAYMFDLATLSLAGTITGFVQPQGACADSKGNVWIADTAAQTIYEVSHVGRLENEFTEESYPVSCAVDPTTGDLAVTNQFGPKGGHGDIAIYKNGAYSIAYFSKNMYYYNFAGYDANGNLFIDGRTTHGVFALMELFEGAKQLNLLKVSGGTIYFPGMVQWNASAQDLIVGDQSCRNAYASCLYTLTIGSGSAKIAATISLKNSSGGTVCDLVQGYVYDGKLFGSDFDFCGSLASATYAWSYPAGGAPTLSNATADTAPIGATVSP